MVKETVMAKKNTCANIKDSAKRKACLAQASKQNGTAGAGISPGLIRWGLMQLLKEVK